MVESLLVAGVISLFLGPLLLAGWVLRPLDRSARYHKSKGRFMMVDFFGLVFLVQLPIALVTNMYSGSINKAMTLVYVVLPLVSALVWWTAVTTFAKAGITNVRTRMLLVFVVLPIAYVGSLVLITLGVTIASHDRPQYGFLAMAIFIFAGMIVSGIYTRSLERRLQLQSKVG